MALATGSTEGACSSSAKDAGTTAAVLGTHTGVPAQELKYSMPPLAKESATTLAQMQRAMGKPLPACQTEAHA